jgi:integrase
LQLIASDPDKKWQFAYQLLGVYGLRPEELRFLVVKDGELWTMYEKSMGGTKGQKTKPRKLAPLSIKDGKGFINWNLQERLEKDEALAPIGKEVRASDALKTRLSRNPVWNKFKKNMQKNKKKY